MERVASLPQIGYRSTFPSPVVSAADIGCGEWRKSDGTVLKTNPKSLTEDTDIVDTDGDDTDHFDTEETSSEKPKAGMKKFLELQ